MENNKKAYPEDLSDEEWQLKPDWSGAGLYWLSGVVWQLLCLRLTALINNLMRAFRRRESQLHPIPGLIGELTQTDVICIAGYFLAGKFLC